MATHSSILAWKIPWMEEFGGLGGLQSMVSQRVRQEWGTNTFTFTGISHQGKGTSQTQRQDRTQAHPACKTECSEMGWVGGSVQLSCSVMSNSLRSHGLKHARPPCPSPTPRAYSNSCRSSWWCHPTISSSVIPFSSRLQSFPASGSVLMSQFFASGGQSTGISASPSILPMNIQDWFILG